MLLTALLTKSGDQIINIRDFLLINSHPGWIYQCCFSYCVWDSCCSQWYNLFVPLNLISLCCARALSRSDARSLSLFLSLSPRYSITRLQDALTLSPFSSYTVSEGVCKAMAQQAALYSVQTRQQCERRCSFTQKSPNKNVDNLRSSNHCQADKGTAHACTHTC